MISTKGLIDRELEAYMLLNAYRGPGDKHYGWSIHEPV
jgi:hypothetical protein